MKIEDRIQKAVVAYLRATYRRRTNLAAGLEVKKTGDDIQVFLPSYVEDIEKGRRPGDKPLPIRGLLQWMRRAGIPDSVAIAYRIQQAIVRRGVKPKQILKGIDKVVEETVSQYFTIDLDDNLNIINK